ncbi:MAG: GntR family transcriptional regulator [Eubacteriales bacterium]|nr:GntR family transcriptional regulator [Eubacteriales bacterium]
MDILSLRDIVYDYLVQQINSGKLKPNDRIIESVLAEELDISRTPIREALIQLASEGIIENIPRKGFRVRQLDVGKVIELYEMLSMIDSHVAGKMANKLDDDKIAELQKFIDLMDLAISNNDPSSYYDYQAAFHDVYIHAYHNKLIVDEFDRLRKTFIRKNYHFTSTHNIQEILQSTNNEHKTILEFFKAKDADGVKQFIRDTHWRPEAAVFDTMEEQ